VVGTLVASAVERVSDATMAVMSTSIEPGAKWKLLRSSYGADGRVPCVDQNGEHVALTKDGLLQAVGQGTLVFSVSARLLRTAELEADDLS
jgi:hypothetical protein